MKAENLKRANEISGRLEALRQQLSNWRGSVSFNSDTTAYVTDADGKRAFVRYEFLNIEVCKALALVAIEKEIKELEKELETL